MAAEVKQNFVRSFIDFLQKQIDELAFKPDAQESCEVAIQCLQAAFDLVEEETEEQSQPSSSVETSAATTTADEGAKMISLYDMYETHCLEKNPDILKQAETIKNEGNRLMKNGKYNEALLQYNRAIVYDPKNPIFYCNRAAAYIRLGDNERAIIDCKSALVYNPNYGKAYGRLGIAYSNLRKYEEAQEAYSKAIELEPENQDYRNNLEVARNNRNRTANVSFPLLTQEFNSILSNPVMRNMIGPTDGEVDALRLMAQNPTMLSAVLQHFFSFQGGDTNAISNEVWQLCQSLASQLPNAAGSSNRDQNSDINQPPSNTDQQQPPTN